MLSFLAFYLIFYSQYFIVVCFFNWKVLKWEDVEVGEPKEGEIRVKNKAIGLNFIDVYFRKGVYKPASMPFTPGSALYNLMSERKRKFSFFLSALMCHF